MATGLDVTFRPDVRSLARVRRDQVDIARRIVPSIVASTLTGTVRAVRKRANARLRRELRLPASIINKKSRVKRATPKRWTAAIITSTNEINLATEFPVRTDLRKRGPNIIRAGSRRYPGAFVQTIRSTPVILFRKTSKSYPLGSGKVQYKKPSAEVYSRLMRRAGPVIWKPEFRARLRRALAKRGHAIASHDITEAMR